MGSKPKKISASRVSAILGLNEYKTPIDAWIEICNEEYTDFEYKNIDPKIPYNEQPAIKVGLEFENPIMNLIGGIYNREYAYESGICTCHLDGKKKPYLGGILPSEIFTNEEVNTEIKTTNIFTYKSKWGEECTGLVPEQYRIQCQQQMGLSGLSKTFLYCLVFPVTQDVICKQLGIGEKEVSYEKKLEIINTLSSLGFLKRYYIDFNSEIWSEIQRLSLKFWNEHVLTRIPPDPVGYADIKRLLKPVNGTCIATPEITEMCMLYNKVNEEFDRAEKNKDFLKSKILQYMSNNCCNAETKNMQLLNTSGRVIASFGKVFRVRKEKEDE